MPRKKKVKDTGDNRSLCYRVHSHVPDRVALTPAHHSITQNHLLSAPNYWV